MKDALALELRGVTKRFGPVVANDGVDLDLRAGEVHALLGENGAGKSTLMNVLYGLHRPDEGTFFLKGEPVDIRSPRHAMQLGIGMVHQHFMLIPVMTVAENIVLAGEPKRGPLIDFRGAEKRVRELSERFGLAVDPTAVVEDLSVGEQQRVEILRALYRRVDVLILDEPTAVLTAQETEDLFGVLRALKESGVAIVFISHKLKEVKALADRVTVLRRGKKVSTVEAADVTETDLANLMVGREVLFTATRPPVEVGEPLLEVRGLEVEDERGLPAVRGLDLEVRGGEIVGIAGVDGNGQTELVEALTGLRPIVAGEVRVHGKVGHIAEDRHRRGLILDFKLAENLSLRQYKRPPISRFGWLFPKRMNELAAPLLEEYDVRGGTCDTPASALSGGNQQKVVIAREIAQDPAVLLAAQPTRGLDVGAIEFVHKRLLDQRSAGRAVLLISFELEEIRALSDRVLVLYEGHIVGEFAPDASDEELGVAMLGGATKAGA